MVERVHSGSRTSGVGAGMLGGQASDVIAHDAYVKRGDGGLRTLHLMVDGLHCGHCVSKIESTLARQPGVNSARVNMTTHRLVMSWRVVETDAATLIAAVTDLGYAVRPYDPDRLGATRSRRERDLLRAMAVAGFAAANVMLLSISIWAGQAQDMGPATRDLLHWFSALIAMPAIAYAGQPFFRSALAALAARRANMDVPISLAVVLAAGMSLYETISGGPHTYFDSAVTLLFFLLVGRYLDSRARGKARSAAEHLLALRANSVTVMDESGAARSAHPESVMCGMIVLVAAGERVSVDGRVVDGASDVDTSLISGESLPRAVGPGDRVFAGTLNVSTPLRVEVTAVGEHTLLSEIVGLMEAAEQGRAKQVMLADRITRLYVPAVHGLAAATLIGWLTVMDASWQVALMNAVAVLIITCPCALALAVPVVQVVASGRLLRRGVLLKSATALERLARVDTVAIDKTGTLTVGQPELLSNGSFGEDDLKFAASLAAVSRHPLARALSRAIPDVAAAQDVQETPGFGLSLDRPAEIVRLGSRRWCGVSDEQTPAAGPELWLARSGRAPVRFAFADSLRDDAGAVIAGLKRRGLSIEMLSGDLEATVSKTALDVGISAWRAEQTPIQKSDRLQTLAESGHAVLMVGDGLNDAPALATASVSMSPSSAADVSQNAADIVFQGDRLAPVAETLEVARHADRLVKQNFGLALAYNAITVPLAMLGMVTPLVAAVAMSASSLAVTVNALRLNRGVGK